MGWTGLFVAAAAAVAGYYFCTRKSSSNYGSSNSYGSHTYEHCSSGTHNSNDYGYNDYYGYDYNDDYGYDYYDDYGYDYNEDYGYDYSDIVYIDTGPRKIYEERKEKKRKLRLIEQLAVYRPSDVLLNFDDDQRENKFIRNNLPKGTLTINNSNQVFCSLLELEDVEELRTYLPLIQRRVCPKTKDKKNYEVSIAKNTLKNIEDIVTPYCDEVVVIPYKGKSSSDDLTKYVIPGNDGKHQESVAIISGILKSKLTYCFQKSAAHLQKVVFADVIIRPRREPLRYQRRALTLLRQNPQKRQYLFPEHIPDVQRSYGHHELDNESIRSNPEQYKAVKYIVGGAGLTAPYIVFGPPGTGKTTTIVESILQLWKRCKNRRILITAASNSACDTIAVKLCEYFDGMITCVNEKKPLLRIYSKSILEKADYAHIPNRLRKRSNLKWDKEKGHAYPAVEDVDEYRIIIATLCTIGKYELAHFAWTKPFDYLFIDEAGATSEPETLIAIMAVHSNTTHVILSGDHKQLGPVIKSKKAQELGLGKSLMERLLERKCYAVQKNGQYNYNLQIRLRRNYRSNPIIVNLYNYLYYENDLIAMLPKAENLANELKWSFLPNSLSPIGFQSVYGECVQGSSKSWHNMLEIEVLLAYIRLLLKVDCVQESDIGVITPYKLQSETIQKCLKLRNWCNIEVGSVENFQGREKRIIIASMVRSNSNLGFVKCPRRWNVLLSRPKALLFILGNPATLNKFEDMKFVIDECKRAGNYLGQANFKKNESSEVEILRTYK